MFTWKSVRSFHTYLVSILILVVILSPLPALADGKWFSFGETEMPEGTPPIIKVLEDDSYHTTLEITIPGMWVEEVSEGGYTFQKLEIPDFATSGDIGKPAIPAIGQFVGFLEPSTNSIEYKDEDKLVLEDILVYPEQKPRCDDEDYSFEFDKEFYSQDTWYPKERANASETMIMREVCVTHTGIVPFEYNPAKRELIVHPQMLVTVYHKPGAEGYEDWSMPIGADPDFADMYRGLIVNYDNLGMAEVDTAVQYDYLIVTNPIFSESAETLKDILVLKGHNVYILEQNTSDWHVIYNLIKEFYLRVHNKYVVLIGDVEFMPIPVRQWWNPYDEIMEDIDSDTVYSCLVGDDIIPEVAVGRFSVGTTSEANLQVNKVVEYWHNWYQQRMYNIVLMSHIGYDEEERELFYGSSVRIRDGVYSKYHPLFHLYAGHMSYSSDEAVIDDMNDRKDIIINYFGHGSGQCWYHWDTYNDDFTLYPDILAIDNGVLRTVVFSIACWTGDIRADHCFCEMWMDVPCGAVATIGATGEVYIIPDSALDEWLFRVLYDRGHKNIGLVQNEAKLEMLKTYVLSPYYPAATKSFLSFQLLGDPSLEILPYSPTGNNYDNQNTVNNEKKQLTVSQNEIALKFFPNPTEGSLNIEISNTFKGSGTIEIYDLSGRLVDKRTIELNDGFTSYVLDCSEFNLKSGLYIVRMNILGNSYSKKFLYTVKPN